MTTGRSPAERSMPLWTVPFVWAFGLLVLYVVAPWALSLIGPRVGWAGGSPSAWNYLGIVLSAAAFAILLWCMSLHFARYQRRVPLDSAPRFLLLRGPYKFSRNPMYIADSLILLGWAVFYGSLAVLLGCLAFASFLAFVLVPSEERLLLARFGDEYARYRDSVPRWLGKARP